MDGTCEVHAYYISILSRYFSNILAKQLSSLLPSFCRVINSRYCFGLEMTRAIDHPQSKTPAKNQIQNMHFEQVSIEHSHSHIFAEWGKSSRLEERTCRPILDGKRVPPKKDTITLSFSLDGVSEPVGRFQYFDINVRNNSAEFGYMVNPNFRQQGVGTKMLKVAITHLFTTTHLHKLYCQTAAFNIASVKLLEKLGFQRDGVLREHHELVGELWDDYIYSILRREWQELINPSPDLI